MSKLDYETVRDSLRGNGRKLEKLEKAIHFLDESEKRVVEEYKQHLRYLFRKDSNVVEEKHIEALHPAVELFLSGSCRMKASQKAETLSKLKVPDSAEAMVKLQHDYLSFDERAALTIPIVKEKYEHYRDCFQEDMKWIHAMKAFARDLHGQLRQLRELGFAFEGEY